MMLLLAKKKPCSIILPFLGTLPRFCSATGTQNPVPRSSIFSLNDYLVASWGFSPEKAASFSIRHTHLKSPEKPDAVLRFLNHQGFSQAEIQKLVTWYPTIFFSCPETILEPNLNALRNLGLSSSAVNNIILTSPGALQLHSAVGKINFWWGFFGGNEAALVKAFRSNKCLIDCDIGTNILTKISFLESRGFSSLDIQRMICMIPRFMKNSVALIEKLLERTQELGFHPKSGMFVHGLKVVSGMSRETLQKKLETLKSFGWSEEEFLSAFRKAPNLGLRSEENLRAKMSFLLGEASCDLSYIVAHPVLLLYCLDKRMRPRQHVLHRLQSKGLFSKGKGFGFYRSMSLSNSKFVEKYIVPNKNEIPDFMKFILLPVPVVLLPCWKVEVGDYF